MKLFALIILSFLIYPINSFYHCRTFRTTWERYVDHIFEYTIFDYAITPLSPSSYSVKLFNMFSNGSFPIGNLVSVYTGGLDGDSLISYCNVSYCNITQTPCIFTCSNIPYYGFTMSLLYYGELEPIMHNPFLIYENMTYPAEKFRMFTPDWEQDVMYEDIGELWQGCIEFDYIPEVDSEATCTNFSSNTLVYNGQQLLFNFSINVYYHDPDRILVTTEQKFNTTGYVILDTPNGDGLSYTFSNRSRVSEPITYEFDEDQNFISFRLSFYDVNGNLSTDLIPIEFYSIQGLRLKKNLEPFTKSNPNGSPVMGPKTDFDVTSSFKCTNFVSFNKPTTRPVTKPGPTTCPSGWYQGSVNPNKCYNLMSSKQWKVWDEAKLICNEMQAELLSIDSAFENNEIQRVFALDDTNCNKIFLGYNRLSNNTWIWDDGSQSQYTNWQIGYPIGIGESCAVQLLNGQYEGQWFNEFCFQQECFMCQMNL